MWLKFMYLEFSTRIVHNLGKLRLTEGKIFNSEINLLLQNYENIKADLKIKHDSMRLLMIKYPLILNDQNISTIGHLYDHPKVWKEFFSDIKEITSTGAADSEEVIAHQMLVKEFTIGLQKILKRFDLGVEGGGGIEGGGGGGGGGGKDPVDWRADLFNVLKGDIDLENPIPNKQVVSQKISQDAIDNANMKAAELLAQEPGFKSQKPNTRGKTSKGKQKNKGGKKRNPNTKKSTPNEKKQSYEAEGAASAKGHQATFEEAVQNAMYATLGSGAKFAEVKRVKRWDISNLDAPYILEHPDIFPEYRGLSERELNHQILLHSGNRLHRLLMDPNLLEKFAHKVKGGFTMDAILHLKDGTQVSGRFEFGLGEQDQKVFHRGFRRHMWGRDFQNLAEVNLGNGEQQRQQHQDEEEEFKAVGGSTVKVDEEENIIVTYENHSFVAGCTILPKR
jgi:hypothetical protein